MSTEQTIIKQQIQTVRARILAELKRGHGPSRSLYHLYAFVRGRSLASLEPRVSEHNLPSLYLLTIAWGESFGKGAEPLDALRAWIAVPEERIRRYGPRVPKMRPTRNALAAAGE